MSSYSIEWKHDNTREHARELSSFNSALEPCFTDRINVPTFLDEGNDGSSSAIEVVLDSALAVWKVDISCQRERAWWKFDTMQEALEFAVSIAKEVDLSDYPYRTIHLIIERQTS
jgi:hypothetical protein